MDPGLKREAHGYKLLDENGTLDRAVISWTWHQAHGPQEPKVDPATQEGTS